MHFSDMEYIRPDAEKYRNALNELTDKLVSAKDFECAEKLFIEKEKLYSKFSTMYNLAYIRHDINTKDAFYDTEKAWFDSHMPELEPAQKAWDKAMLESRFRDDFSRKYGKQMFTLSEIEQKTFSPEIIPFMQKENELSTEYSKLLASAQIPFDGGVYTLAQLGPFKQDADDSRRLNAWIAEGNWYKQNRDELDRIYDELTHLRDRMGKALGYEGYTTLGYYRMARCGYGKEEVEKFRNAVKKYLVPVAEEIYRKQAARLQVTYPMSFADAALEFRSGNPVPCGGPEQILEEGRAFYHSLSEETAEFIDVMLDNGLMDVLSRTGKAGGGYCTAIEDYKVPFIFANFNGTSSDVETVTHEAGHAFAAYLGRNTRPISLIWPTMEACEVHSMSMEFFAWNWAEHFYGNDARKFRFSHLAGALTFIPYGTMVDHFQHEVYAHPDMSPDQRHAIWKKLLGEYMPWLRIDGEIPFYGEGMGWQRQHHIYEVPFYYIDYCLAQTMALQFWALLQEEPDKAWATYMKYTRQAGTKSFGEIIETAGLKSPFGDEALSEICLKAHKWLNDYDMTGIV